MIKIISWDWSLHWDYLSRQRWAGVYCPWLTEHQSHGILPRHPLEAANSGLNSIINSVILILVVQVIWDFNVNCCEFMNDGLQNLLCTISWLSLTLIWLAGWGKLALSPTPSSLAGLSSTRERSYCVWNNSKVVLGDIMQWSVTNLGLSL